MPVLEDHAARHREPVLLRSAVDVAPGGTGLDPHRAALRIDMHVAQLGQVDHEAAVGDRGAGHIVPAAADGDGEVVSASERHALAHVRHPGAARDQGRVAVDHAVPHAAGLVVAAVAGPDQLAGQTRRPELLDHRVVEAGGGSVRGLGCSFHASPPK